MQSPTVRQAKISTSSCGIGKIAEAWQLAAESCRELTAAFKQAQLRAPGNCPGWDTRYGRGPLFASWIVGETGGYKPATFDRPIRGSDAEELHRSQREDR